MTNNFRSGASEKLRVRMSCASRIARNAGQLQWGDAMAPDKQATLGTALQGYWATSGGHQVSLRKAGPRGRVPAKKPKKQQRMRPGKQFEAVTNPLNDDRPSGIDLWHKIKDKVPAWANTAWREWERIFRSKIRSQTRCRMTSRGKNGYGGQLVFAKG
jgi:hypothetical protein